MKRVCLSLTGLTVLLLLTLGSGTSLAATAINPNPVPLFSNGHDKVNPAISGSWTAWTEDRSNTGGSLDIYGEDLSAPTPTPTPICVNGSDQETPAISGNWVVWTDWRNATGDIYGRDLTTATNVTICTQGTADQYQPAISGNVVVWADDRNSSTDVYASDISTGTPGTQFPVCLNGATQDYPAVSGNVVVWEDHRNGNWDIYGASVDMTTHTVTEFPICTAPGGQRYPQISGNTVVWQDSRDGTWDVYGYDLSTQSEFPICTEDSADQVSPEIDGNTVVWQDFRDSGNGTIYGYYLPTGYEYDICSDPAGQENPAISGHQVVWTDWRGAYGDLYGSRLVYWDLSLQIDGGVAWTNQSAATLSVSAQRIDESPAVGLTDMRVFSLTPPAWPGVSYTTSMPWTFTGADGTRTVQSQFRDVNLLVSPTVTASILYDTTAPVSHDDAPDGWVNHQVIVDLSGLDAGSGVASTTYSVDFGPWQTGDQVVVSAPADHSNDGLHYVDYYSTDNAGNVETSHKSCLVRIDTTTPVVTPSLMNVWRSTDATVQLVGSDTWSGLKDIEYTVDGGSTLHGSRVTIPADKVAHTTDGVHRISVFATDYAGNVEATQTFQIDIDTQAPVTLAPKAAVVSYGKTASLKYQVNDLPTSDTKATVTITVSSKTRVVKTLKLGLKPTGLLQTAMFKCLLKKGSYTFTVTATDQAGNSAVAPLGLNKLTVK